MSGAAVVMYAPSEPRSGPARLPCGTPRAQFGKAAHIPPVFGPLLKPMELTT